MKLRPPQTLHDAFQEALRAKDVPGCGGLLRQQAWQLLGAYLNGGIGRAGLLFPVIMGHSTGLRQQAAVLAENWCQLQTVIQTDCGFSREMSLPVLLVRHYQVISQLPAENCDTQQVLVSRDCELSHPDRVPLSFLREDRQLRSLLHSFWVHGSSAEGVYRPGWSDIDTLAIVSGDTLASEAALRSLRRRLLSMKAAMLCHHPIQLHGHFILAEPDLAHLPEAFFPPVLFQRARLLPGFVDRPFVIHSYADSELALSMLWYHGVRDLIRHGEQLPQNNLRRVAFLHRVYLLPCMILQARGMALHKADLYADLPRWFDAEDVAFLERISEIWRLWKPAVQNVSPRWKTLVAANPVLAQRSLRSWVNSRVSYPAFENQDWSSLTAAASRFAQKHWLQERESRG